MHTDKRAGEEDMADRVGAGALQVDKELYDFINDEALPGTGVSAEAFWSGLDSVVHDLAPRNRELLATRDELQARIDAWYQEYRNPADRPAGIQGGPPGARLPGARGRRCPR